MMFQAYKNASEQGHFKALQKLGEYYYEGYAVIKIDDFYSVAFDKWFELYQKAKIERFITKPIEMDIIREP
jgi:TPR repeat protein